MKQVFVTLACTAVVACAAAPAPLAAQDAHAHHGAPATIGYVPAEMLRRPVPLRAGIGELHDPVTTASPEAQRFYNQGMAHLHSYAFIEAARSFEQALRLDGELALAYVGLSRTYANLFDPGAAGEALQRAQALRERVTPREQRRIDAHARHMEAAAHPGDAARHLAWKQALDAALAEDPDDAELWILRGIAEEPHAAGWGGQLGGAASIAFYEAALTRVPDHFAAHHYLIHSWENVRRFDRAVFHGEIYARLSPRVAHAQHMLAHDLMKVGRVSDAVRQLALADSLEHAYYAEEQIPRDRDWHHPHNQMLLALSYRHQGRLADAERVLRAVEDMTPSLPMMEAWYRKDLAELLLVQGRAPEAQAIGQELTRGATPLAHALGNAYAAQSHLARKRPQAAKPHMDELTRVLDTMGDRDFVAGMVAIDLRAAMVRGEYLLRTGQRDEGAALLRDAIRQSRAATGPDEWIEALFRLEAIARLASDAGAHDLAAFTAQQMMEHDPSYAGSHFAMARAAQQAGDAAAARKHYAEAARLWADADVAHPDAAAARKHAGRK